MESEFAGKALRAGVWYTVSNFLTKGLVFITTPLFTRMLTHSEFGEFNNFISWLNILSIMCTLNLESTFGAARYDFNDKFDEYVSSVLALSTVSILTFAIIINIFYKSMVDIFMMDRLKINILFVYLVFITAVHMYQARERYYFSYKKLVILSLMMSICTVGVSVVLVYFCEDKYMGRIIGHTMPTIIIGMVLYFVILFRGRCIKSRQWKYALPIALPYIPHLLSLTLLNSMDRVQITRFCGSDSNALYSLAYTSGAVVCILLVSMNNAYAPWLSEKLNQKKYMEIQSFSKIYIGIFCVGLLGIMLISPEILLIMGGESYITAKYVMPPIAFGCACQFIYTMFVNIEQFRKKTIGMAIGSATAALVNYLLNLFFIPRYGYIAAAYTTLISFLWLLIAHMIMVKKIHENMAYSYKYIFAVLIIMFACTLLISSAYGSDIVRYIILFVYCAIIAGLLLHYRDRLYVVLKIVFLRKK